MKTNELTGAALDYWVAKCQALEQPRIYRTREGADVCEHLAPGTDGFPPDYVDFRPSTDWADCGPLIDKFEMYVSSNGIGWEANCMKDGHNIHDHYGKGRTSREAVCRAVVRAAFGDEIHEVPATTAAK